MSENDRGVPMLGVPLAFAGFVVTLIGFVIAAVGHSAAMPWLAIGALCLIVGIPLGLRDPQGFTEIGAWIATGALVANALVMALVAV